MSIIVFGRATPRHDSGILRLQSANYIGNLSECERREGFLSAEFSQQQITQMVNDLGITIATDAEIVAGYLCAFRNEFNHGSPVLAKMFESYGRLRFQEKPLRACSTYVYGPVCIDRAYRGRGLLRGLYEAQKKDLAGRFEVGVAFVSRDNPRSLRAHTAGLGMTEVGDFEVKGNTYVVLAFALQATPSR
jgi:predicted GNAT superfamily acetyltransferase